MRLSAATIAPRRLSTASSNSGITIDIGASWLLLAALGLFAASIAESRPDKCRSRASRIAWLRHGAVDRLRRARLNGIGTRSKRAKGTGKYRMTKRLMTMTAIAVMSIAATATIAAAQDVAAGQHSFNKCLPCH